VPRNPTKENSYKKDYRERFDKLPNEKLLTGELLEQIILERSKPATRNRKGYCFAYRRLAEFAGIEGIDFHGLAAGYKAKAISPEQLPTDEQIKEVREKIKNPAWRWIYSMLAVYGLRPHEVFSLDTSRLNESPGIVKVSRGTKTGERLVWPCLSEWWEEFEISQIAYPGIQIEGCNNNDLGKKITWEFRDRRIPFSPYKLRHAYAIRTAVLGVEAAIAAKWMGHSVTVHTKTYHQAIDEVHHQRAFELMRRNEEALAPKSD